MGYEEFKEKILEELRNLYGDGAEMYIAKLRKNNGVCYDGLQVRAKEKDGKVMPIIRLDELYEKYLTEGINVAKCVQVALMRLKENKVPKSVMRIAKRIKDWNYISKNVYPMLLSTEDNREILQNLASISMLDLSVVYIIRTKLADDCTGNIKISKEMMEGYGLNIEELHRQAMENLKGDGYKFRDMESIIRSLFPNHFTEKTVEMAGEAGIMHILTNSCGIYGAAGILDKELLKQFAGEQDYIILPSSVHETIFVPVTEEYDKETFDKMVAEVNRSGVRQEERLADHSYYYHAGTGEIGMCA